MVEKNSRIAELIANTEFGAVGLEDFDDEDNETLKEQNELLGSICRINNALENKYSSDEGYENATHLKDNETWSGEEDTEGLFSEKEDIGEFLDENMPDNVVNVEIEDDLLKGNSKEDLISDDFDESFLHRNVCDKLLCNSASEIVFNRNGSSAEMLNKNEEKCFSGWKHHMYLVRMQSSKDWSDNKCSGNSSEVKGNRNASDGKDSNDSSNGKDSNDSSNGKDSNDSSNGKDSNDSSNGKDGMNSPHKKENNGSSYEKYLVGENSLAKIGIEVSPIIYRIRDSLSETGINHSLNDTGTKQLLNNFRTKQSPNDTGTRHSLNATEIQHSQNDTRIHDTITTTKIQNWLVEVGIQDSPIKGKIPDFSFDNEISNLYYEEEAKKSSTEHATNSMFRKVVIDERSDESIMIRLPESNKVKVRNVPLPVVVRHPSSEELLYYDATNTTLSWDGYPFESAKIDNNMIHITFSDSLRTEPINDDNHLIVITSEVSDDKITIHSSHDKTCTIYLGFANLSHDDSLLNQSWIYDISDDSIVVDDNTTELPSADEVADLSNADIESAD